MIPRDAGAWRAGGQLRQRENRAARRRRCEKQERVVLVGMKLQLALEFPASLRVGFFATELEDGVAQQGVSVRIFWIELNGFAKFGNGGFRKTADGIGAADENVQGGGISIVSCKC